MIEKADTCLLFKNGKYHVDPVVIDPDSRPACKSHIGGRHKRLDLKEDRPAAFIYSRYDRAFLADIALDETAAEIRYFRHAFGSHPECSDLVGSSESIFERAEDAEISVPLAAEAEDAIHHVFYGFRTCKLTGFCHMGYDEDGDVIGFGKPDQQIGASPDLRHASCGGICLGRIHRLYRVYYQETWLHVLADSEDVLDACFGIYVQVIGYSAGGT